MAWYAQLVAAGGSITPSPFPAAGTPHLLEVAIGLGASLANNAALTALMAPSGMLANTALQLHLTAVLQDEDAAGNTLPVPAVHCTAVLSMDGAGGANAMLTLQASAGTPPAPPAFMLYGVVDFGALVSGIDAPTPGRSEFTRRLVAKVVRGAGIVAAPVSNPPSRTFTLNSTDYTGATAIMQAMDPATNCFPGTDGTMPAGCALGTGVSVAATVYAAPGTTTASAPCSGAPGATTTPCERSFAEPAPARLLLFLQDIPSASYAAGNWTSGSGRVAYLTHGHSAGVRVSLAAPCFPAPACAGAAGTTMQSWTLIMIIAIAATALVVGLAMWALRDVSTSRVPSARGPAGLAGQQHA